MALTSSSIHGPPYPLAGPLVGTQFASVDLSGQDPPFSPANPPVTYDPTGIGQNAYLANLVIETNYGLQNFQGLPPGLDVIEHYGNNARTGARIKGNPSPGFLRQSPNLAWDIKHQQKAGWTMGGCMGCHGVAQLQGFSFSFVLLGGSQGAKTDTETHFDLPLGNSNRKTGN